MAIYGLRGRQPFQNTLTSFMPARQLLRSLHLYRCRLTPPLDDCPALSPVTELHVQKCPPSAGGLNATLSALLRQAPQLQRLTVLACLRRGDAFPESLRNLAGPTRLCLDDNNLETLPEGPCWAGEPLLLVFGQER